MAGRPPIPPPSWRSCLPGRPAHVSGHWPALELKPLAAPVTVQQKQVRYCTICIAALVLERDCRCRHFCCTLYSSQRCMRYRRVNASPERRVKRNKKESWEKRKGRRSRPKRGGPAARMRSSSLNPGLCSGLLALLGPRGFEGALLLLRGGAALPPRRGGGALLLVLVANHPASMAGAQQQAWGQWHRAATAVGQSRRFALQHT